MMQSTLMRSICNTNSKTGLNESEHAQVMTPERMLAHEMDAQLLWASGWLQRVAMVDLDGSGRRLGPGGFLY